MARAKLIFIIGGAKSGKSNYAIELAKKLKTDTYYIATAVALDKEMKQRIKLHKISRPKHWKTIEEEINLKELFKKIQSKTGVIILDCLTLFLSNLLMKNAERKEIEEKIKELMKTIKKSNNTTIIISNEVGLGIVPKNNLARKFRDIAGKINQMVAQNADKVYFLASGIPLTLKGGCSE